MCADLQDQVHSNCYVEQEMTMEQPETYQLEMYIIIITYALDIVCYFNKPGLSALNLKTT